MKETKYLQVWSLDELFQDGNQSSQFREHLKQLEIKVSKFEEKLKFFEGCIRQAEWLYDHYVDHIVYGMLVKDWNK
ncbi:hypothetical protein [Peribacillus frigoritolerans]|uniref:hypothetical protein n=1 Tax=Peribacillus frigoritolerans TaxID=450367 RepID=UPI003DA7593C